MTKQIKIDKSKANRIVEDIQDEFGNDVAVNIYVKKKQIKQSTYVMFYQAVNLELVKILPPNACKVLLYLMSKTQYDNYVGVDQLTIMEDLGYKRPKSVNDAIKLLKEQNIVLSMPDLADKRRNVYYINPYQSWKGDVRRRVELVKKSKQGDFEQLELPFTDRTNLL
jgi:hypothetical protein